MLTTTRNLSLISKKNNLSPLSPFSFLPRWLLAERLSFFSGYLWKGYANLYGNEIIPFVLLWSLLSNQFKNFTYPIIFWLNKKVHVQKTNKRTCKLVHLNSYICYVWNTYPFRHLWNWKNNWGKHAHSTFFHYNSFGFALICYGVIICKWMGNLYIMIVFFCIIKRFGLVMYRIVCIALLLPLL